MATIAEIRAQYPQYNDMSDEELGQALHRKFYSDMPYEDFAQRAGIAASAGEGPEQTSNLEAKANKTPEASPARTAGLAARALGRGVVADTLGSPADMREAADAFGTTGINILKNMLNVAALPATEKVLGATGLDVDIPDIPDLPYGQISQAMKVLPGFSSEIGSDQIADAAETFGREMGVDLPEPETSGERLFSNVLRYGSGALTGSAGMTKAATGMAAREAPAILRPYAQSGTRMLIGDTGAGVGTGAALHLLDENAPEWGENPLVRLFTAFAGGITGAGATGLARLPRKITQAGVDKLPASGIAPDPETGLRPSNKDANLAAEFVQSKASDPKLAAENIGRNQAYFDEVGGAMPTTGLMSDDEGLKLLDKAHRNLDPKPFVESDKAVRDSAFRDIQAMRPEGASPSITRALATGEVVSRRAKADREVQRARTKLEQHEASDKALVDQYSAFGGQASRASEDLDKVVVGDTLRPMQGRKNELYGAIDPDGDVMRPLSGLAQMIESMRADIEGMPASVQKQTIPEALFSDIEGMLPEAGGSGAMSFRDMNKLRSHVSGLEKQARSTGQFPLAESYNTMRSLLSLESKALAAEGTEAGARALEAERFFREDFAPLFAQGEGGRLRRAINSDDPYRSNTPPTRTAGRFLHAGPAGKEAAADLQRILASSPNPAEGAAAARRFVLDDMAKVIGNDGKVSEIRLQQWINSRTGMLSQIPALEKEVTDLLRKIRGNSATSDKLKQELESATSRNARTQREIDKSALALVADSDPHNAVQGVLNAKDPVAAAREIESLIGGIVPAERGWRAAVADYLFDSVSNAGKHGVPDDAEIVSLAKLTRSFRQHEPVLKIVFGDDMRHLYQARRRLELLSNKATQAGAGSPTIENLGLVNQLKRPAEVVLRLMYGALEGGSRARKMKILGEQLPNGAGRVNALIKRAMFDPDVAKHLLNKHVPEADLPAWSRKLNLLMGWAEAGREAGR